MKAKPIGKTLIPEHFTPAPVKRIKFADGIIRSVNRRERRRLKIYNKDLK